MKVKETKVSMFSLCVLLALVCLAEGIYNKLQLIDLNHLNYHTQNYLVIKSNFKGSVIFKPSDHFMVEFNTSAATIQELHAINYTLVEDYDVVTLHVNKEEEKEEEDGMRFVGFFVICVIMVSISFSLAYVCWLKHHKTKEDGAAVVLQDSSQAPLLEMSSAQSTQLPKNTTLQHMQTDESCVSSEDDNHHHDNHHHDNHHHDNRHHDNHHHDNSCDNYHHDNPHHDNHLPRKTPPRPLFTKDALEMEAFNNSYHVDTLASLPGADSLGGSKLPADQFLTSFSLSKKKGGQYVPIAAGAKKFDSEGAKGLRAEGGIPDVLCTSREEGEVRSQYISLPYPSQMGLSFGPSENRALKKNSSSLTKETVAFNSPRGVDGSRFIETDIKAGAQAKESSLKKSKHSPRKQAFTLSNRPTLLDTPFHFSPLSSGTDRSSDSGRMTDEAYGTLGSTVSNNTTSTGSDSSGSVVTIIAAESESVRKMLSSSSSHFGIKPIISNPSKESSSTLPFLKKEGKPTVRFSNQTPTSSSFNTSLLIVMGLLVSALSYKPPQPSSHPHPEVHLTIHVPPYTPIKTTDFYVSRDSHLSVVNLLDASVMRVNVYDIEVAEGPVSEEDACKHKSCGQACDQSTGKCVCKRGFELTADDECQDVDECQMLEQPCHSHARCINEKGNFSCECQPGYHGDGFHCKSCDLPCPDGFYEVKSCRNQAAKRQECKKCSTSCEAGFFISENCTHKRDIRCTRCRSECSYMDYEFKPCIGPQDRVCKEIRSLPAPKVSSNMVFENRKEVSTVSSYRLQDAGSNRDKMVFLTRPTGYGVQIKLKEINLAPLYQAVNHAASNDNHKLKNQGLTAYCPYPIPEKYNLTLKLHEGITTRATHHTCASEDEEGKKEKKKKKTKKNSRPSFLSSMPESLEDLQVCNGESGFFASPTDACETYMLSGKMPQLDKNKASIVCVKASRLTDVFDVSHKFDDVSTTFLDVNITCANRRTKCDDCLRNCAKKMVSHRGSHACNVTAEDADNGESPRLQYCYSCCNKRECSEVCDVYYDKACPQIRCLTGNIAEVTLEPVFSADTHVYACHIEPVPNYTIYHLEFSIIKDATKVTSKVFRARRNFSQKQGHPYQAEDQHEFLNVKFESLLDRQPNILQGSLVPSRSVLGFYQATRRRLLDGVVVKKTSLLISPQQPFAVNSLAWKNEDCDSEVLWEMVRSGGDTFKEASHIQARKLDGFQWALFNNTQQKTPSITFTIPADASIMATAFGLSTVKDDRTLRVDLLRREMFWELLVEGELLSCPGSFNIEIREPEHPHSRMFDMDVGVSCPSTFSLSFAIPADTPDIYNKTLLVDIKDAHRTIKMTVFRPFYSHSEHAAEFFRHNKSRETLRLTGRTHEEEIVLMTSPVVVLCVLVASLALVLLVGIVTESEGINEDKLNSGDKLEGKHYCFIVFFACSKALYSVLVTFTLLVVLIKHLNRDSMATLSHYRQLVTTANDMQRHDIEGMQLYVRQEVARQNHIANQTKHLCHLKLTDLQEQLERAKESMEVVGPNHTMVQELAVQYTKQVVANLTRIVNKFKKEFTTYANKALEKLKRNIVQTSSAIESSKWMDGPRIIYDAVKAKRSKAGLETKPFLQWAGIKQEVDRLVADMSLKDFPLPNLTEFINSEAIKPAYKPLKIPKSSEVILPQNQWYYQFDKKMDKEASKHKKQEEQEALEASSYLSFTTFQIILLVIDVVWFVHRMAGAFSTVGQIAHGCPVYISCHLLHKNDKLDSGVLQQDHNQDDPMSKRSKLSCCLYRLRDINFKIMSTDFVPKMVASVTAGCLLYIAMAASHKLVSIKTLAKIGYFDALMGPLEASYSLAATSVKLNAHKINSFELPLYEQLINTRFKRYQLLLDMYEEVLASSAAVRDSEHCMWKRLLKPDEECECSRVKVDRLMFEGCPLPRVIPQPYLKFKKADLQEKKRLLSLQTLPYVDASRKIASNTGFLIAIFVLVLSLIDLLNNVVWMYLKRFNLLKILPLFEVERVPFLEEPKD